MSCYHSLMTEDALFNVLLPLSHAGMEPPGCPGVTRESRGVSGSFGEGFGTRFGHVAQKEAEAIWGVSGLVRDLECNYALRVFIGIFYHQ